MLLIGFPMRSPAQQKLILHLFLHSANLLDLVIQEDLRKIGISHEQARYLDGLVNHGPISISALSKGIRASQPAVTTMIVRLEALGLGRRETHPTDRRIVLVSVTKKGKKAWERAMAVWKKVECRLLAGLSSEQIAHLHDQLLFLRNRLGGHSPFASR